MDKVMVEEIRKELVRFTQFAQDQNGATPQEVVAALKRATEYWEGRAELEGPGTDHVITTARKKGRK